MELLINKDRLADPAGSGSATMELLRAVGVTMITEETDRELLLVLCFFFEKI